MARPRKDQEGPTAVERMEEAFWEILAEKPYAQITVGEIAKRAQVNKNAFYYHFDGLGALAAQALDNMLPREMARMLLMNGGPSKGIDEIEANALLRNPDLKKRIDRALLVVGKNGSSELVATLKNLVMHTWFDLFHVDETRLSSEAMVVVRFTLGGLVEIMPRRPREPAPGHTELGCRHERFGERRGDAARRRRRAPRENADAAGDSERS